MESKRVQFKNSAVDMKERTFTGYASIFGNIDNGNDIVMPGAFTKTIKERGDRIKVQYNHYHTIGRMIELEETKKGLWVKGYISDTQMGNDVLTLMNDKAVDEMSFQYDVIKHEYEDINGQEIRLLKELRLYEAGPVDFAMNEQAQITAMKSIMQNRGVQDKDVEEIINSILDRKPPEKALPEKTVDPLLNDVLNILSRIEDRKNISLVRSAVNAR